jgi:hypothetical protein
VADRTFRKALTAGVTAVAAEDLSRLSNCDRKDIGGNKWTMCCGRDVFLDEMHRRDRLQKGQ